MSSYTYESQDFDKFELFKYSPEDRVWMMALKMGDLKGKIGGATASLIVDNGGSGKVTITLERIDRNNLFWFRLTVYVDEDAPETSDWICWNCGTRNSEVEENCMLCGDEK